MSEHGQRAERSLKEAAHLLLAHGGGLRLRREVEAASGHNDKWVARYLDSLVAGEVIDRRSLRFTAKCGLAVGVAVGAESLRAALLDANGQLFHPYEARLPDQLALSQDRLLARIGAAAADVLGRALRDPKLRITRGRIAVLGITVAWPLPMDRDFHPKRQWLGDRRWGGVPLNTPVARMLGGPFTRPLFSHAINDANAAAMAFAYDESLARIGEEAGTASRILIALRLSSGIGAGTMELTPHDPRRLSFLDSSLIVGTSGYAGEVGHLPTSHSVIEAVQRFGGAEEVPSGEADGRPDERDRLVSSLTNDRLAKIGLERICSCGAKSGAAELDDIGAGAHLEVIAGARAFADRLRESGYPLDPEEAVGDQVGRLLDRDDPDIERALWECGALIGRAMAAPILMLDPAKILLTGFLAREPVATGFNEIRTRSKRAPTNTVKAEVRRQDGFLEVRGAALGTVRDRSWRQIDVDPLSLPTQARPWTTAHQNKLEQRVAVLAAKTRR